MKALDRSPPGGLLLSRMESFEIHKEHGALKILSMRNIWVKSSISNSGGHFAQPRGTSLGNLVEGLMRNICVE